MFISSNYCLIDTETKNQIKQLRSDGASPGFIRKKFNLSISADQLYNISRKDLFERFNDEIIKLHNSFDTWNKEYSFFFHEINGNFNGITLINRRIVCTPYASDIVVIDDTMCINRYQYPVIPCFCYDDNDRAQMLAVGIIVGKTTNDFMQFLNDLKKMLKYEYFYVID